ncbi:hypothetical protein FFLO_03293 [Filobasidium floriforme]|uniref:DUF6534 domain-containing protein n=1 Tax=Filobasidium floriforme TaxID=5210 RepID=A0A8K0JN20_9TREE|nr:uncharacterized protein HD553DRAFT_337536 [Filobasidium floriforme]KAG7544332.1 hypothetical protein FFLO_03293 [Filobasidium floriforme]KAH8078637.1 hypothetical protein HD553DRAFT_337536 [Filobasidium floriforme]
MSMGTGTPPMNILEPIIKAQMEKDLFKNLGGFIVGYAIDAAMFGMMLVMLTDWLRYAPKESKTIKAVLAYSVIAGTVGTAFNIHIMIFHFMQNFGKFAPFVMAPRSGGWAILGCAFYAMRAFRLNNNNYFVLAIITMGILTQFGDSISISVLHYSTPPLDRKTVASTPIYVWVSSTFFTDGLITGFIIYGLKKNKTGYTETSRLINKLVTITIEAALPATITSIGFLATFVNSGNTDLFILFWEMFHPKMYILPFIAVLNSRTKLRREGGGSTQGTGGSTDGHGQHSHGTFILSSLPSEPSSAKLDGIHIETKTERQPNDLGHSVDVASNLQEHPMIPYTVGLNRQRRDDESSIGGLTDERHGGSTANDSTTALSPFAAFRQGQGGVAR